MTTVTIKLPDRQAKLLKQVDLNELFQQFVADFLENRENIKLSKEISNSKKITRLSKNLERCL